MFKNVKEMLAALHKDQSGSYFVEVALVLIGVAFVVFSAAHGLANDGIAPKYDDISDQIEAATVPTLN